MQISYLSPRFIHVFPVVSNDGKSVHPNIFNSWFVLCLSRLSQNMLLMKLEFLYSYMQSCERVSDLSYLYYTLS